MATLLTASILIGAAIYSVGLLFDADHPEAE